MRRTIAYRLAALGCLLAATFALAPDGSTWTASNLKQLGFGHGDKIYNYDFESTQYNPEAGGTQYNQAKNNVDWAVSLLFYNNAYVGGVKSAVSDHYDQGGLFSDPMRFRLFDQPKINPYTGWIWDEDSGRKTGIPGCFVSTRHFRIYAPGEDNFYNPDFGFYLFGTTHRDHNELERPYCPKYFDDSEGTEYDLAGRFSAKGYYTRYDYAWFYNQEFWVQQNHHWENDGHATYIRFP